MQLFRENDKLLIFNVSPGVLRLASEKKALRRLLSNVAVPSPNRLVGRHGTAGEPGLRALFLG
jgi:hypothetical protein